MFYREPSHYKNIKIWVNEKVLIINHFFDGKILGKKLFCDGDVLDNNNVVMQMISSTINYTTAAATAVIPSLVAPSTSPPRVSALYPSHMAQ